MPKPPKIPQSVLVIIHTPALEVLLIERADHAGFWQSVTGSKDFLDEPLAETAAREVGEETGIKVGGRLVPQSALFDWQYSIEYEIYPQWRHRYAEGVIHNTEHWFSLQVPEQLDVLLAPREHTAFVWLPYEEAASRCFSSSNADAILQLPGRLNARLNARPDVPPNVSPDARPVAPLDLPPDTPLEPLDTQPQAQPDQHPESSPPERNP